MAQQLRTNNTSIRTTFEYLRLYHRTICTVLILLVSSISVWAAWWAIGRRRAGGARSRDSRVRSRARARTRRPPLWARPPTWTTSRCPPPPEPEHPLTARAPANKSIAQCSTFGCSQLLLVSTRFCCSRARVPIAYCSATSNLCVSSRLVLLMHFIIYPFVLCSFWRGHFYALLKASSRLKRLASNPLMHRV